MTPLECASIRSIARCVLPVLVGPSTAVTPAPGARSLPNVDEGKAILCRCFYYSRGVQIVIARSQATKQSIPPHTWRDGLLRCARNDGRPELTVLSASFPPILFHFATPLQSRLKLWNESRTNRARIGDSLSLPLRSPQHLAWNSGSGTRSSPGTSHKRRFFVEFLKAADKPESNQKWVRVNRIPMVEPLS
jgi:hypothetical protein